MTLWRSNVAEALDHCQARAMRGRLQWRRGAIAELMPRFRRAQGWHQETSKLLTLSTGSSQMAIVYAQHSGRQRTRFITWHLPQSTTIALLPAPVINSGIWLQLVLISKESWKHAEMIFYSSSWGYGNLLGIKEIWFQFIPFNCLLGMVLMDHIEKGDRADLICWRTDTFFILVGDLVWTLNFILQLPFQPILFKKGNITLDCRIGWRDWNGWNVGWRKNGFTARRTWKLWEYFKLALKY